MVTDGYAIRSIIPVLLHRLRHQPQQLLLLRILIDWISQHGIHIVSNIRRFVELSQEIGFVNFLHVIPGPGK